MGDPQQRSAATHPTHPTGCRRTTAFVAYSNEDGRPVKEFCPGVAYAVKVGGAPPE
jgi:hypothetical protein